MNGKLASQLTKPRHLWNPGALAYFTLETSYKNKALRVIHVNLCFDIFHDFYAVAV